MRRAVILVAVLGLVSMPAAAQVSNPAPLVLEGDVVAGVGTITRIDNVAVNNNGDWFVEADTDFSDTDADQVLLRNGALFLREGDVLPLPVGATLDSFDSVWINNPGDGGFNFFLNSVLPTSEDSGIYFNTDLVIQESDVSTAPEFTPGTPYIGFFDVKLNDGNLYLAVASIDDPAISSSVDRALVRIQVDAFGNLVSESVFAKEGDVLPGQVEAVADFGTGPHQSDINNAGQLLFFADLAGSTSTDGTIYLDNTLLAQEGSPSPVAGRNYQFLSSRGMALSNPGGHFHKANLDGSTSDDELLVLNGAVYVREGDTLPDIAGFNLTSFGTGSGPLGLDDDGDVLWYGDWNDLNTDIDTGLFLNQNLIVQEGVTTVGGVPMDTISSGSDAFEMSDNGQYIIFEATLDDGTNGAFLIQVQDGGNQAPVAVCQDVSVDLADACEADVDVDGGSFDPEGGPLTLEQSPPGPYPIGRTVVTLTVTDDQGASDTCTAVVNVQDVGPPEIDVALSPDLLWPPNHRLVDIDAAVAASDLCGEPTVVLETVTSDEPDNGQNGDGNTNGDIQGVEDGTPDFAFQLRAERAGNGDGRTYTVVYVATDPSGNMSSAMGTVFVPHDQGGVTEPVTISVAQTAAGTAVDWPVVPGASHYTVISGKLADLEQTTALIRLGSVRCIELESSDASTVGSEDANVPAPGEGYFYLVEYDDGAPSGWGTESAPKPRIVEFGGCSP